MKLVFKKTIVERLLQLVADATNDGRSIDHIEITLPEAERLRIETKAPFCIAAGIYLTSLYGYEIRAEKTRQATESKSALFSPAVPFPQLLC